MMLNLKIGNQYFSVCVSKEYWEQIGRKVHTTSISVFVFQKNNESRLAEKCTQPFIIWDVWGFCSRVPGCFEWGEQLEDGCLVSWMSLLTSRYYFSFISIIVIIDSYYRSHLHLIPWKHPLCMLTVTIYIYSWSDLVTGIMLFTMSMSVISHLSN